MDVGLRIVNLNMILESSSKSIIAEAVFYTLLSLNANKGTALSTGLDLRK